MHSELWLRFGFQFQRKVEAKNCSIKREASYVWDTSSEIECRPMDSEFKKESFRAGRLVAYSKQDELVSSKGIFCRQVQLSNQATLELDSLYLISSIPGAMRVPVS